MERSGSLNEKLNTILFTYIIIPQCSTSISPAELLKLNSKLNIIKLGAAQNKSVFLPNVTRQFN